MSRKKPAGKPVWTKNTFFWIAGVLVLLAVTGVIFGHEVIRDPGQKLEKKIPLSILYLVAAIVMVINGVLSHRQTLQQFAEESGENN